MRSDSDLTTRARIRDAAIATFGDQGFAVGVRTIAEAAGVSPGLVNHHFGSKDGLRAECDAFVLEAIRRSKSDFMHNSSSANFLAALAEVESFAPLIAYLVRSFQAGGNLAAHLFNDMVANAETYMQEGVDAGLIRPSRNPKARARYLALVGGGGLMLYLQLKAAEGPIDYRQALQDYTREVMGPSLEIYTEGLITDPRLLETWQSQQAKEE
ncbi:TetR/AcrR family transcriptional regulator [Smaragdicoccus niigatensis]|uniref:TetR/AcrR family transcriptional regulator n=1 Tax=Smaragdicoccus niigatensis TaxID=359359 RepID=UPI0003707294|nr:TetR family transcriptional regulator [Smaragdicoccus niigatensis]